MTKKVKNTINPNQLASAYFLYCNLSNTYKIGLSRKVSSVAGRIKALKRRYGYGDHLNTITTINAKYSDISALETYLHKKYESVQTKRIAKMLHYNQDGSTFVTNVKLNGAYEWFKLNNDQVEEVKTYFKMA